METIEIPAKILGWMLTNDNWWDIICGGAFGVNNQMRREILLALVRDRMYSLAFVLLKTHGDCRAVEQAIAGAAAGFADEAFIRRFLTDIAERLDEQEKTGP